MELATERKSSLSLLPKKWSQAIDTCFKASGEHFINTVGSIVFFTAAAHAAYLALVPAPLRITTSMRSQGFWKKFSLGSIVTVALYDSLHTARITRQQEELQLEARLLRARLREYDSQQ